MEETPKKECTFCEKFGAVFGMAIGIVFVFVSIDLISGGRLSGLISKKEVTSDDV